MPEPENGQFSIYPACRVSADEFVEFWFSQYKDELEPLYVKNIGDPLTRERTLALYEWKKGGGIPAAQIRSVEKNYISRIKEIRKLPLTMTAEEFLDLFPAGGAIWRIFWLHCWQQKFPIYDQHVFRAMAFIRKGKVEEIPTKDADKIRSYIDEYLPFSGLLVEHDGKNQRQVDRALWTFGKFIKSSHTHSD